MWSSKHTSGYLLTCYTRVQWDVRVKQFTNEACDDYDEPHDHDVREDDDDDDDNNNHDNKDEACSARC